MKALTDNALLALTGVGVAAGIGLAALAPANGALALAMLSGVAGVAVCAWRMGGRRRRADHLAAEVARLEAVLAAAVQPWCARDDHGRVTASPEFASLLAPTPIDGPESVAAALAPADASIFAAAWSALAGTGRGFRLEVQTKDGRRVTLGGRHGDDADQNVGHNVVWIEDVTPIWRAAEAERAARADAERRLGELYTALDALPLPVWLRRDDLAVIWCNRAYAHAVGATPERVVAERLELIAGAAGRLLAERASAAGTAQSQRSAVVVGNQRRMMEVTEAPLSGPSGGLLMVGHAVDTTAEEEAVAALSRHQAANAEVLERLSTAIAVFGPDQRLRFFNQAYARLWDVSENFLRQEPTHAELLEELRAGRKLPEAANFQSFKRERLERYTHLIEPMEELMHLPDGTTLRVLVAPHPLGGIITIQEDVTNALALESSYNTLIAVQQETLDNLAEGIAVFGGDGRLKLSNPAFGRVWDLRDADLRGEPHIGEVFERMRPLLDDGGDWQGLREEMIGATLDRAARSGRLERTDGAVVEFSTVPLPDGAVLNSYLDVTDSARLEQALRASNAALEAVDQLKTEFIANVSHHLRTPLNGIIGYAEVLANQYSGPLNPRQAEHVKAMLAAGERMLALIDDVVDLTSIGAGVATLSRGVVDVGDLVATVAGLTREWARREGLCLEVKTSGALGVLDGDEKRLKQALFSLVVSAIRQPPSDGRITLSATREGGWVTLGVGGVSRDGAPLAGAPLAGASLASASLAGESRAGARFERADARAGPALGLALVRSVIELHGGRLEIDETVSQGLSARCLLPAASTTAASVLAAGRPDQGAG